MWLRGTSHDSVLHYSSTFLSRQISSKFALTHTQMTGCLENCKSRETRKNMLWMCDSSSSSVVAIVIVSEKHMYACRGLKEIFEMCSEYLSSKMRLKNVCFIVAWRMRARTMRVCMPFDDWEWIELSIFQRNLFGLFSAQQSSSSSSSTHNFWILYLHVYLRNFLLSSAKDFLRLRNGNSAPFIHENLSSRSRNKTPPLAAQKESS